MVAREMQKAAQEAERAARTVLVWGLPDLDLFEEVTDLEIASDDELIAMLRYFYRAQSQANARRLLVLAELLRRRTAEGLPPPGNRGGMPGGRRGSAVQA
jgi:hypothetical protein